MTAFDLLKSRTSTLDILNHKDHADTRHGVTDGGFHKDVDGDAWYVKHHANPDHAYTEHVANQLYRAAGHNAPHSMILHDEHKNPVYFSKKIEGFHTIKEHWEATKDPARYNYDGDFQHWNHAPEGQAEKHFKGLAADYLVHATDMHTSNVGFTGHGTNAAHTRIDNGGAFHLSGFGRDKWEDSLNHGLNHYVSAQHAEALSRVAGDRDQHEVRAELTSPAALRPQVKKLAQIRQAHGGWEGFVEKHAAGAPDHLKATLVKHLNERHERLLQHVTGVRDWTKGKEAEAPPAPAKETTPPRRGTESIKASNDRWIDKFNADHP